MLDQRSLFPESWQTGAPGVLLLFIVGPLGSGIPLGIIMARDSGLSPLVTAGLYLVSDILLAFVVEPELAVLRWFGRRNSFLGLIGQRFTGLTRVVGLQGDGVRGPLGLVLLSFTVEPITSRVAARAAGHGFVPGWTLAIIGDMAYFGLIMVSTLWVANVLGDERVSIGVVLIGMWVLPLALRRLRRKPVAAATGPAAPDETVAAAAPVSNLRGATARRTTNRRQRPSRGLHR